METNNIGNHNSSVNELNDKIKIAYGCTNLQE